MFIIADKGRRYLGWQSVPHGTSPTRKVVQRNYTDQPTIDSAMTDICLPYALEMKSSRGIGGFRGSPFTTPAY